MKVESGLTSSVLLGRDLEIDFRFSDFNYKLRLREHTRRSNLQPDAVNIYKNVFVFASIC